MKLRTVLLAIASTAAGLVLLASAPAHGASTTNSTVQWVPNSAVAYTVEVQTGTREDAETDDTVRIKFYGSIRISPWVHLDNPGDDRERGQLDVYGPIYLSDLGRIYRIDISFSHEDSNAWYLDWVYVYPTYGGEVTFYEFYDWMSTNGTRTLYPS